ncbi:DNA-binding transcriptional regulator, MerR family [Halobacillus alkaliphilus]|uniref:DNA-binding transcriptional regulator, MerR family n=1 Tax=Halobacillus alkaliphilus TaxID=396056 RepID=A0A1I2PST8_9BACI|nr:MerR family transcriptional regulator [Halobacillus alkaliphilus]SFG19114.1 DNA-binding transcriptional regulator, MerR family [Halobacillus alkaliphilus]
MYKVKEVARLTGVSVRTLHHYHDIGLLRPSEVKSNGYRYYSEKEITRLQQILFFREVDFSLSKIKKILDAPDFDQEKALRHHKKILIEKSRRLERIILSVEQTLQSLKGENQMTNHDRFQPFDKSQIEQHEKMYEQEVKERWGETEAYQESKRRTKSYSEKDWKNIQEEGTEIDRQIIGRMDQGPDDLEVQRLIDEKRKHISKYFYDCQLEIFRGLADLYVSDPRFTKNIDLLQPGYAEFLRKAMYIYCNRMKD